MHTFSRIARENLVCEIGIVKKKGKKYQKSENIRNLGMLEVHLFTYSAVLYEFKLVRIVNFSKGQSKFLVVL